MLILAAIAACSLERVIGCKGQIPWHSPKDLFYFKKMTEDAILIMGRKTLESLPGLLPKRVHLVITSKTTELTQGAWYQAQLKKFTREELEQKVYIVGSVAEAKKKAEQLLQSLKGMQNTVYVAGGGQIYEQLLPECCIVYLTQVRTPYKIYGDAYFPNLQPIRWKLVKQFSVQDGNIVLDFQMFLADTCKIDERPVQRFKQIVTALQE